jgi:cyanate permease
MIKTSDSDWNKVIVGLVTFSFRGLGLMVAVGILSANLGFEGTLSYWQALAVVFLLRFSLNDYDVDR